MKENYKNFPLNYEITTKKIIVISLIPSYTFNQNLSNSSMIEKSVFLFSLFVSDEHREVLMTLAKYYSY
jgi:hypothetical protein